MPDPDSPNSRPDSDAPNDLTRDEEPGAWPRAASMVTGIEEPAPARIGRYRILRLLGEGGMGAVYEAEQDLPHRTVALKLIRAGCSSPEMLRRFENEAQALGRLRHPGIAQIYEAGRDGNQPYFAMELVHGETLLAYCEEHKLTTRERLELAAKICDAVQHAHQRGLIHRDLKPANILVEESGQPRILDFGVARLTDSDAHATRQTDIGQLVGTLAYMSPEQVLGDPEEIDTRSDVYALGVILYELLAGQKPYAIGRQLLEAVRTIREEEPTALGSVSRAYRGDVETIVAKALEKDKTRRYGSAAELAADIRRHLHDEPITARPPTASYQLQKFARRNKALVIGPAVVFVVLVAGVAASTWEAVRARRAETQARQQSAIAQAVNDFLQKDLLGQASAFNQSKPDPNITVRTVLDRAAQRTQGKFDKQPEVEAAIRFTIGDSYEDLALYTQARKQLARALELQRRVLGPDDPKTLATLEDLAWATSGEGKFADAEALFVQSLNADRRVLGAENRSTLHCMYGLAGVYLRESKYTLSEQLYQKALGLVRRVLGAEDPLTLRTMAYLADAFAEDGKYAEAEEMSEQALTIQQRTLGADNPDTLTSLQSLALAYAQDGKYAQSEVAARALLEGQTRILGPEHGQTLWDLNLLGSDCLNEGKYAEGEAIFRQALKVDRRVLGPDGLQTLDAEKNLAQGEYVEGRDAEAESLLKDAWTADERVRGAQDTETLTDLADMTFMYQWEGKYALAETYATQALAGRRHTLGPEHPDTMASAADLALAYLSQGKFAESEPLAREALEAEKKMQPENWQRFRAESLLGASLAGEKKYTEAEPLLVEGYQGMLARKDRIDAPERFHLQLAHRWVVQLYQAWGKPDKAAEWKKRQAPRSLSRITSTSPDRDDSTPVLGRRPT